MESVPKMCLVSAVGSEVTGKSRHPEESLFILTKKKVSVKFYREIFEFLLVRRTEKPLSSGTISRVA